MLVVPEATRPVRPDRTPGSSPDDGPGTEFVALPAASPAGRAAAEALRAIARTARSFLYYEPTNDAIRDALQEVARRMLEALRHGDLELEIRPTELVRAGEVVYREPDRERSLAFRLYRDGVRRLTIARSVTWDELVGLLGVLSIRYTGVRQQEDDIVTLLWRQRFAHITSQAVEGFVAVDDELEDDLAPGGPRTVRQAAVFAAPYHFEEPVPAYSGTIGVVHRPLTSQQLEDLRAADAPSELAGQCVDLLDELLRPRSAGAAPLPPGPLLGLVREIRGYLAGTRQLRRLAQAHGIALSASGQIADDDLRNYLARELTGDDLLAEVVSATLSASAPPSAVADLARALSGNPLPRLIELLSGRWTAGGRDIALPLLERATEAQLVEVVSRLRELDIVTAADLLPAVESGAPSALPELAAAMIERGGEDLRLAAVQALDRAPRRPDTGRMLASRLDDQAAVVRVAALKALAHLGDPRPFDAIVRLATVREAALAVTGEAEAIGEALTTLDPDRALATFESWLRPSGTFAAFHSRREGLWWAAAVGLARLPGPRPAELLRFIRRKSSGPLKDRSIRAAVHQRHLGEDGPRG